jgi:Tfp pilus assembly protein PilO
MKKIVNQAPAGKPRTWLITALLAAAAVAYVVFIFLPVQRSIRALSSRLQEKRQQVVQAQSLNRPLVQARQRLVETRNVCLQWREQAPRPQDIAQHFATLTQQAQDAGVAIVRFDPQAGTDLAVLSQHHVVLHFRGEFAQVFDFLSRLERLPTPLWVRDVRLAVSEEPGQALQGELTLTIFVDRADYSD